MRKVKFRGKAVMSTEQLDKEHFQHKSGWIYGNLIVTGTEHYIVGSIIEASDIGLIHEWWVQVEPSSVGQFTGLKDKNVTEIYEGDVTFNEVCDVYGTVIYDEDEGAFLYDRLNVVSLLGECHMDLEVAGNIYENTELLEVGN